MAPPHHMANLTPHCAICGGDSSVCTHEADSLRKALNEAQSRWLAREQMHAVRHWVLTHARETVLASYQQLETQRRAQYEAHLATLPFYNLWLIYQDGAPLPPPQLEGLKHQMHQAWDHMHRTLDKDWQNCLQKYPELLDYFFGLVELQQPDEQDVRVEMPMVTSSEKKRKGGKRVSGGPGAFAAPPPMMGTGVPFVRFAPGTAPAYMPGPFAGPAYPGY